MALTEIQAVRLKTGDKSNIVRELFTANGTTAAFKLQHSAVMSSPAPRVWKDNIEQTLITNYTIDSINGIVTLTATPAVNSKITVEYYWSVFTDEEVQHFLTESSSDVTIASARLLLAVAADKAKVAIRETLQGGGGMGAITHDTSVAVKELRETAKALIAQKIELFALEGLEPADQLTEIAWTVFQLEEIDQQSLIREGIL